MFGPWDIYLVALYIFYKDFDKKIGYLSSYSLFLVRIMEFIISYNSQLIVNYPLPVL